MREVFVIEVETGENVDGEIVQDDLALKLSNLHRLRRITYFDLVRLPVGTTFSIKVAS